MPSTPKLINPYLTPPDHIATQNDTNILHSVDDAHQQTSKWSSHEDKELRPPAPQNEETPCESLSDASISFSCNEDNFCPIPHIEEDEDTNSSFTNHPYHPSTPPGSSNGCARQLTSENGPRRTPQPHDPVDHNTNEYKKEILTTIYTQNAQGLWRCPRDPDGNILVDQPPDLSKLEYIIDYMRQKNIGAWLVQETWEEGDEYDVDIGGYRVFRHNSMRGDNGRQHLFKGVAIILSPTFHTAWKAAGSPPPITTDPKDDFAGRIIRLDIKFDLLDARGKKIKGKSLPLTLISVYFPCDDPRHSQFCSTLDSMLNAINPSTQIIIGSDINARIGTRSCEEHKQVLGPFGIERDNTRGENVLHILGSHNLRVENTFFQHRAEEYVTYTSIPTSCHPHGVPSMHDIFACSQSLHKRVQDCKAVLHGVASDHQAVRLCLALSSIKFKAHAISRGTINWPKILSDEHTRMVYNEHLASLTTPDMEYDDYQATIMKAGELTATHHKRQCDGWFQMSRTTLAPLLKERNQLLHSVKRMQHLSTEIQASVQADLKRLNRHIAHAVSHAKAMWNADICAKIHDMKMDPRLAWEHIRLLTKGESAHHRKLTTMAMRLPDGTRATTASENMSVFAPHFHKVFNAQRTTDSSVLDNVPQRRTMWELNDPISWEEFSKAVRKLKNAKAPGLTGVPPEAFKAMSTANLRHVYKHVNDFFLGDMDHEQWHRSQCIPVPKSGDLSDPNKWRGVMLMDVCSKIFSSVMNGRAFKLLETQGTKFQFGGTPELGCRDGLFVLKTMLTLRKNHNLPTYVGFVDLVKAYDTANHALLFDILERYGAPPKFVNAVERIYQDLVVVLKIEKEIVEIPQSVGVRQGDNMAPVLFLFLMSAFAETLEIEWKAAGIDVCTVRSIVGRKLALGEGKIRGHLPKEYMSRTLTAVEIFQCLYVDDGAFIFSSRANMTRGLALVHKHFGRLGLEMHIGRNDAPSKTECIFFPPPGFLNSLIPLELMHDDNSDTTNTLGNGDEALTDGELHEEQKTQSRREQEEKIYDTLEETQPINIADGYVTFCRHFKYLGSYVSFGLCDDYDIEKRVTAATQSMGALSNVWRCPHLEIWSKYLLFRAIPMNLLLWGCETWSMRKALSNKLEVFLHRSIRRILRVSVTKMKEERIRNEHVRRMFYDIPRVCNMIAARQLDFIGKVVRGPYDRPAQQMLTACCDQVRRVGRPFLHNKDFIVKNLQLLFANVPEVTIDAFGSLKSWIKEASHEEYWNQLVACLTDRHASIPPRPDEWPRPRRSPRQHDPPPREQQPFPPTPPRTQRASRQNDPEQPDPDARQHRPPSNSPPRRRRPEPPPPPSSGGRDYIPERVGHDMYDSLKILGLGLGASEREVKLAYRRLACIYHPDKWEQSRQNTGLTLLETTAHFQLLNNAQSFLRQHL